MTSGMEKPSDSRCGRLSDALRAPVDRSSVGCACNMPGRLSEASNAKGAFEQLHTELHFQNKRQDDASERIAKLEADLSRIAKLTVESADLQAAERQQRYALMARLAKRSEEAIADCASLQQGQEALAQQGAQGEHRHVAILQRLEGLDALMQRMGRLETLGEQRHDEFTQRLEYVETQAEDDSQVRQLQTEVDSLKVEVREHAESSSRVARRVDAMEQLLAENLRLRQELAQLRRESERRDLEMATVHGQLDALTKLVREQMSGQPGMHIRCAGA